MTNFASGAGESALMGFEVTPGVLPGSAAADKLPVTSLQLAPNVALYEDKAMTVRAQLVKSSTGSRAPTDRSRSPARGNR